MDFLLFSLIIMPLRAKTTINRLVTDKGGVKLGPKSRQIGEKSLKMGIFDENSVEKMLFSIYTYRFSLFSLVTMPLEAKTTINSHMWSRIRAKNSQKWAQIA